MDIKSIRMTLTGGHKGKTTTLNDCQFINGIRDITASEKDIRGIVRYFTRCYHVEVGPIPEDSDIDEPEISEPDDSDPTEVEEPEPVVGPGVPNSRQAAIIAAINNIDKENWVDEAYPRPRVADVRELCKDASIRCEEIVEVMEKWLS